MATESRTALITGASSGLGAAIALEMAARGWKLAIGARRADRLAETAEKARAQGAAKVHAGDLDVTDDASVERFFAASEDALGVADVIVNNAEHWASFGLRDARMLAQGNLGILMPDDVARAVVHAATQPRHVLHDTIELQPSVPRRAD